MGQLSRETAAGSLSATPAPQTPLRGVGLLIFIKHLHLGLYLRGRDTKQTVEISVRLEISNASDLAVQRIIQYV